MRGAPRLTTVAIYLLCTFSWWALELVCNGPIERPVLFRPALNITDLCWLG